jgi:hypothetical protein
MVEVAEPAELAGRRGGGWGDGRVGGWEGEGVKGWGGGERWETLVIISFRMCALVEPWPHEDRMHATSKTIVA